VASIPVSSFQAGKNCGDTRSRVYGYGVLESFRAISRFLKVYRGQGC